MPMKHRSTQLSSSEEELKNLIYSPEKDELKGIERYNDIFNFLENNTIEVDDEILGKVLNFAESFHSTGD
jgi:hypothetical protein